MKDLGYGKGYEYDHDADDGFSGQDYFPEEMNRANFYRPEGKGFEKEVVKRLDYWQKLRQEKTRGDA
ncbi:MAG: replication-associated recombination protein A, partial [Rhodospirillaceae bacterium]|nr:replication-associated recombination protein A [Rhodospirillaceae bacterium]